jgi:TANFOR domain-containing protein
MRFLNLYLTLLLLVSIVTVRGQNYAVQSSVQIMPPYSVYLSDYATEGNGKLQVILRQGDLSRPVYQLRLVMTVELNGRVIMRTSRFFNPAPIALDPGVPTVISGAELAPYVDSRNIDFIGYSKDQYEKTKALPEGSYQIIFTAYDYRRQDQQVSNAGSGFYYLAKNEPPLVNFPACGTKIALKAPQQIVFSWLPRNTSSPTSAQETEYEFELYETRPVGRNPNDIVLTTQPVFRLRTDYTQIIYGPAEPMLLDGMVYVWRVRALDRSGKDAFRNNGYTEVCTFTYGGTDPNFDLGVVRGLQAIGETDQRAKIWWEEGYFDGYRVYYKKTGAQWEWFYNEVTKTEFKVFDLEPDNEYEVRVQGKKDGFYSPFTEIVKFRTREKVLAQCGDPAIVANDLGNPLPLALTGMTIKASDHDVTFIQVESIGQPGWFKGNGTATLPFLGGTYFVYFDRLYVDENREAKGGKIRVASEGMAKMIEEQLAAQKDKKKAEQQKANQEQWAGTDFYEAVIEFNYAIDDIVIDASGNLIITQEGGQTVVNTEVPAILAKAPDKAIIVEDKNGDQYVVQKDKTTGQTKVTKVEGGGLAPEVMQDSQVKNAVVVLVLEQFEEEIDAWLRVNGKGGEEDDEVLLALELPESFPKEAVFLEHLRDRVIQGFKEHPEKLVAKTETEQSNKELLDRVTKLFKTKADIDWKKIENNDQQSVRNAIAKSLIDLSGGEIDLAAAANIAPDCGLKHAGKDKPNGSLYLIRYPETCKYFTGRIVANYILEGYGKYLCAKERFDLLKCLATGTVDGNDENAIITLIKETPRDHAGSLLALLRADNTGVLKNIDSGVDGDNYIAVFKAIQQVYVTATDKAQIDAEVKKIDDAFLSDKSREEKAKQNYFTWFEGGILKAIFSDAAVFNRFDNVAIANNGIVSFRYATDPTQHNETTTPIAIEPFRLVGLKVLGGSNEVADAAQGSTVYIPAIMLPVLISKRGTADFFEALNATMVASGVGGIVTGATRFVIVSGGIDVLLGSSALVVDNYKDEISRMKHGEDFLDAYILVNKAVLFYFGGKAILQLAASLPKLRIAFTELKNSEDFAKLKVTNPSKANQLEKEVDNVLKKSEELAKGADDVIGSIRRVEDELRQVVSREHIYKIDSKGNVTGPVIGEIDKVDDFTSLAPFSKGDILTHNHPAGSTFSIQDVANLQLEISELRAVTKNKVYILRKTGNFNYYTWRFKYDDLLEQFKTKYAEKFKAGLTFEEKVIIQEELFSESFEGTNVQFIIE